jgi:hypothetical protein
MLDDNLQCNKDLLLMRNRVYEFIRNYDKYTRKLKSKIVKLKKENSSLKENCTCSNYPKMVFKEEEIN